MLGQFVQLPAMPGTAAHFGSCSSCQAGVAIKEASIASRELDKSDVHKLST